MINIGLCLQPPYTEGRIQLPHDFPEDSPSQNQRTLAPGDQTWLENPLSSRIASSKCSKHWGISIQMTSNDPKIWMVYKGKSHLGMDDLAPFGE